MWAYEWSAGYWVRVVEWKSGENPQVEVPGGVRYWILRDGWKWLRPVTREEWEQLPSDVRERWTGRGGVDVLGTVT